MEDCHSLTSFESRQKISAFLVRLIQKLFLVSCRLFLLLLLNTVKPFDKTSWVAIFASLLNALK